ncbi:tetratricopeptide repeat protein [Kineobactrum salinum]|uniref:Tetratricopeptide repeat protein n=1 Tax=Kineobactrum salinum TaxID=2708301 RepID=A0A6C0TZX4_9GAMM|nr:tetratricopeptide repeat protein [Kineobactrum salinum]QIB64257.1 tetratricopeptide repeat protein [Kineobactrum salinum]
MNSGRMVLSRLRSDLDEGRFTRVLARCERLLASGRRHPVLWSYRGRALEGLRRDSEALAIYREASLRFPGHAQSRLLLGKLCARLGRHEEAHCSLEQALQLDPELIDGYRTLLNYRAIAPDDTAVRHILARARSKNHGAAARARALFILGQIHVEAGLDQQGFEYYRNANELVSSTLGNGSHEYLVANNTQSINAGLLQEFDRSAPALPVAPRFSLPGCRARERALPKHCWHAMPG